LNGQWIQKKENGKGVCDSNVAAKKKKKCKNGDQKKVGIKQIKDMID